MPDTGESKKKELFIKVTYGHEYSEDVDRYINIVRRYLGPGATKSSTLLFALKRMSEMIEEEFGPSSPER